MHHNSTRWLFSVSLATLLMGFAANADAQKILQWQFEPGQTLNVWFTQDMTVQMTAMGQEMESAADMGMLMKWDIQQVNEDGSAHINQSIERLTMRLATPGTDEIEYDSAHAEKATGTALTLKASVDPLVGVEFTQTMSSTGEILDVQLTEQSKQQLNAAPAGAQLREVLSRDGLKALLSQAATVFPTTPISPGDSWTGSTNSKSPVGPLSMEMTYEYVGTEMRSGRPLERIDVDMTVAFPEGAPQNGMNISVQNQRNTGSLFFDAEAGRFVETELHQNMRMVTSVGKQQHSQLLSTVLRMTFEPVSQVAQATATVPTDEAAQVQPATYVR